MDFKGSQKKTVLLTTLLTLLFVTTFVFAFGSFSPVSPVSASGVEYRGVVCTSTTGDFDGRVSEPGVGINEGIDCKSNLLTNAGANAVRDILGQQTTFGNFTHIALCNASLACGPTAAGDTTLESEFTLSGLQRAAGAYAVAPGVGNWSVAHTFTAASDNMLTNKTGLFNQSGVSGSTLLAENTFTLVTLQTNDQLTINWTITASDGGA